MRVIIGAWCVLWFAQVPVLADHPQGGRRADNERRRWSFRGACPPAQVLVDGGVSPPAEHDGHWRHRHKS